MEKSLQFIDFYEYQNCLICKGNENNSYLQVKNRFNPSEIFQIVQCSKCGFLFLSPRPNETQIAQYYTDNEYQPHKTEVKTIKEIIYDKIRKLNNNYKKRVISKFFSKGVILDYGCGTGEFLEEMKRYGWTVYGYEPSEKARNYAQSKNISMLPSINDLPENIHVITLWHVLEHIHYPEELLKTIFQKLKIDGIAVFAVPNPDCIDAKYYKDSWVAYDAPRHLYHFKPKDMIEFLKNNNFSVIQIKRLFPDYLYNILLSFQLEKTIHSRSLFARIVKMTLAVKLSSIFNVITTHRSSSLIYIARKNAI